MSSTRWVRMVQGGHPAPALRMFCFPYAGAGASVYRDWRLPDELAAEVWAVQPPGREGRRTEPPFTGLGPLVEACADQLAPMFDRPFAFFGHSLGALTAFELTRLLRRRGGPSPVRLFLSAHRAPDLPARREPASGLPDDQFLARLLEMAGSSPSAVRDPELLLMLAPVTRVDFAVCEQYRYLPEAPLDTPITGFAAVDDSEVSVSEVEQWRRHTRRDFRLRSYPGGHLFLRDHVQRMLAEVAGDLVTTVSST